MYVLTYQSINFGYIRLADFLIFGRTGVSPIPDIRASKDYRCPAEGFVLLKWKPNTATILSIFILTISPFKPEGICDPIDRD